MIYEETMRLVDAEGNYIDIRRVTIELKKLANMLKMMAAKVRPDRFRKNIRGPKKPRPKRTSAKRHPHVSTARILAQRKQPKTHASLT